MRTCLLILLASVTACFGQGKKISDYPNTATMNSNDLFIVASGSTNKHIAYGQLGPLISTLSAGLITQYLAEVNPAPFLSEFPAVFSGLSITDWTNAPVLSNRTDVFDCKAARDPGMLYIESGAHQGWWMWYSGVNDLQQWRICLAKSTDLTNWTKYGVVITTNPASWWRGNPLDVQKTAGVFSPSPYYDPVTDSLYIFASGSRAPMCPSCILPEPFHTGLWKATNSDWTLPSSYDVQNGDNPLWTNQYHFETNFDQIFVQHYAPSPPIKIGNQYTIAYNYSSSNLNWTVGFSTATNLLGPWRVVDDTQPTLNFSAGPGGTGQAQVEEPYLIRLRGGGIMCLFDSLGNPGGLAVTTNAWGTNGWIYSGTYGIAANTNSWHQLGVGSAAIVQLKDGTLVIAYSGVNSNDYAFNAFSNSIGIATAKLNYWPAIQPGVITNTDVPLQYAKLGKLSVGTNTTALGSYSLVVGRNNANAGENSLAVGQVVIAPGATNSMAVGGASGTVNISAGMKDAISMGSGAYVSADQGKAIGTVVRARALDAVAIGTGMNVDGARSVGIGAHALDNAATLSDAESILLHVNPASGKIMFDGAAPYMNGANITNIYFIIRQGANMTVTSNAWNDWTLAATLGGGAATLQDATNAAIGVVVMSNLVSAAEATNISAYQALLTTNGYPLWSVANATASVWSTNAPDGFGIASTNYVNSQFGGVSRLMYFSATTNAGAISDRTNNWQAWTTPNPVAGTQTVGGLVLNAYIRQNVSTQAVTRVIAGPASVSSFPFRAGGSGTISIHAEMYYYDTVSNTLVELGSSAPMVIAQTVPARTEFSISIPATVTLTNVSKIAIAFKLDQIGTGGPTLSFANGGIYDAHANFLQALSDVSINGSQVSGAVAEAAHATNADTATWVSSGVSNQWKADAALTTNSYLTWFAVAPGANITVTTNGGVFTVAGAAGGGAGNGPFTNTTTYGNAQITNGVYIYGGGEILSNANGAVTISGGLIRAPAAAIGDLTVTNGAAIGGVGLTNNNVSVPGVVYGVFSGGGDAITNINPANITGSGALSIQNSITATNLAGTNWLGGTNYIGGVDRTNSGIIVMNDRIQFRNMQGNGTNIFYIDPLTGSLLWNNSGVTSIGAVSSGKPKIIYASDEIIAGGQITAGTAFVPGTSSGLFWPSKTRCYSPADGSFRLSDSSVTKDRLYLHGTARALSDGVATDIFKISARTNNFVGGVITWTLFCSDNTERQVLSGTTWYAAANTNGLWYSMVTTNTASLDAKVLTSGTITTLWTMTATTGNESTNVTINVNADTSLTPASGQFYILWQVQQNSTNTITAL